MAIRPISRIRRNVCALLLALLALSWGYFVFSFARDYRTIEQQSSNNLQTLATGFAAHVRQMLRVSDVLLLDISQYFARHSSAELQSLFSDWLRRTPELAALAVIDADTGEVLFSLNGISLPKSFTLSAIAAPVGSGFPLWIADRLYRDHAGDNLIVISRSFQQEGRRLLVVSLLRVDRLLDFPQETSLGPDASVSIFHQGGVLLARKPQGDQLIGHSFAAGPLFNELLPKSPEGLSRAPRKTDGISRIVAHHKLADLPLVVTVGTSIDWLFADWRSRLINFLLIQIVVSVAIVLSVVMLIRTLSRVDLAEIELEKREEYFRSVANSSVDAVVSVDQDDRVRFWSDGAEHVFNCPGTEALGMPISCFLQFSADDKLLTLNQLTEADQPWSQRRTFAVLGQRKSGEPFPTELSVSRGTVAGQPLYTLIVRDITERQQLEDRIRRMASHDTLTQLPNRSLLLDRLQVAMTQTCRQGGQVALLFVDLDQFKPVNDDYGHDTGDQVLQQVAKRMLATVRASDTVARVGGDEFAVLLSNVEDEAAVSRACEHLLTALRRRFIVGGNQIMISCSIGAALFNGQKQTASELISRADSAMYAAKRAGKNRYAFADRVF